MVAYRLHRLGWTQQEIADEIRVAQNNFTSQFLHTFSDLEKDVKNLLSSGIPHPDVAKRFNMPLILVPAVSSPVLSRRLCRGPRRDPVPEFFP